jgi:hypothetical protein
MNMIGSRSVKLSEKSVFRILAQGRRAPKASDRRRKTYVKRRFLSQFSRINQARKSYQRVAFSRFSYYGAIAKPYRLEREGGA